LLVIVFFLPLLFAAECCVALGLGAARMDWKGGKASKGGRKDGRKASKNEGRRGEERNDTAQRDDNTRGGGWIKGEERMNPSMDMDPLLPFSSLLFIFSSFFYFFFFFFLTVPTPYLEHCRPLPTSLPIPTMSTEDNVDVKAAVEAAAVEVASLLQQSEHNTRGERHSDEREWKRREGGERAHIQSGHEYSYILSLSAATMLTLVISYLYAPVLVFSSVLPMFFASVYVCRSNFLKALQVAVNVPTQAKLEESVRVSNTHNKHNEEEHREKREGRRKKRVVA